MNRTADRIQEMARYSVKSVLMIVLAGLMLVAAVGRVHANPTATEHVEVEFLAEWEAIPADGGEFWVALRQRIIPGWHTYWRNPGDSGEPTHVMWALPPGFESGEIQWPYPERLPYGPLVNFGFSGEAVLLMRMTAPAGLTPGSSVDLPADVYWLVCEEICIPEQAQLTLTLPVAAGPPRTDARSTPVIAAAVAALPQPGPWETRFELRDGRILIGVDAPETAQSFGQGQIEEIALFPYQDGVIRNAAPQQVMYGPGGFTVSVEPGFRFTQEGMTRPERIEGVLVIRDRSNEDVLERAVIFDAGPGAIPQAMRAQGMGAGAGGAADVSIGQALLFAVLGGLILNLMPCVFPVLFMKAFGFVAAAREAPWTVRLHGIVFTTGVMVSFAAVAGVLIALRAGGEQIGWGFQLQSPVFVSLLVYLLLLVGLNLSGVFQVGTSVMGFGGSLGERSGLTGSFFTGVLATVVATPCVAPFMAAAIGFALSQPVVLALSIFLALGFGMALPWLALSFAPGLLKMLPRPGPWMDVFKQILAFPIYGTAAWLFWVLTQQMGAAGLAFVLAGAVLTAYAGWAFGAIQDPGARGGWRLTGGLTAAVALIGALALVLTLPSGQPAARAATQGAGESAALPFEPYSPERLDALLAEGKPVFVNFTAAWCISCLVNERVALSTPAVAERMAGAGIVYLKGDWTNRDPVIAQTLDSFGRSGVPLYLVYPAGGAEPIILPQLLTETIVLDAFDRAVGDQPQN